MANPPANFTVTPNHAKPGETLTFHWSAATGDFKQYRIFGTASTGPFTPSVYVDSGVLTATGVFPDDLPDGEFVEYRVVTFDGADAGLSSDNVSVFCVRAANTAPSTPGFISVTPAFVRNGELVTVSWGPSTDPDGNLRWYELEKCVNGVWQPHFKGDNLEQLVTVEPHWKDTVRFRVRAVDTEGLYSDYAVSEPVTILADIFPDGGRLELFENEEAKPVFPLTVLDGVFRRSDKKPLSAILADVGAVQGPAGQGVPTGGTAGQVLAKKSAADYDTQWVDPPEGGCTAGVTMEEVNAAIQQAVLDSWEGSY